MPNTPPAAAISRDMDKVLDILHRHIESHVHLIPELANRLISAGGKRVRARTLLQVAHLCGYQGEAHLQLAAAVEMMHTATLFHDDVVDDATIRRNVPSANATAGNAAAVLVGDFLLGQAFQLMVATGCLDALRVLSAASARIAEGEVQQLVAKKNLHLSYDAYLEVITAKTATLFAAAAQTGGCIANAEPQTRSALADFGLNLGIAFQIADDLLDYEGDEKVTGKSVGADFREQKITLPVLLATQHARNENNSNDARFELEFWQRTFTTEQQGEEDFATALTILRQRGCLERSREIALHHARLAQQALGSLPAGEWKELLHAAAQSATLRTN